MSGPVFCGGSPWEGVVSDQTLVPVMSVVHVSVHCFICHGKQVRRLIPKLAMPI